MGTRISIIGSVSGISTCRPTRAISCVTPVTEQPLATTSAKTLPNFTPFTSMPYARQVVAITAPDLSQASPGFVKARLSTWLDLPW